MSSTIFGRAAAGALALPFVLAVPSHDAENAWWNVAVWALIAAVFLAGQFVVQQVMRLQDGKRLVAAFAALHVMLGLLGFTSIEHYRFEHAVTDLGLLYLIFFCAAVTTCLAPALGRTVFAVLTIALSLAAIVQAVHVYAFGFSIGPDGYRAILQSNAAEALEFVGRFLEASTVATAAVAVAVALAAAFGALPVRARGEALAWSGLYALAAIAVLGGQAGMVKARIEGFVEAFDYAVELAEYKTLRAARQARGPELSVTQTAPLADHPQTYVFVVSESLTRNHMSLYGYWRDTTPGLRQLADELTVFTDVVSPHSHTDQSLELVLTLANQANGLRFTDSANFSLIELLRAAGFTTWWISNQNAFGPWDNKTSVLAAGAERVHYTGPRSGRRVTGPHDEALLDPFAAALRDPAPRKAIFLHFLGNHWEYAKRYPPQAAVFRAPPGTAEIGALRGEHGRLDLINEYDNAVHYHDGLVARIVKMLRLERTPAALLLFSDHGESVFGLKSHYWKQFTRDHVEVPLLVWFSSEYASLTGDLIARSRAGARLPFALEDLPHLVGDLLALRSPLLQAERSPLSDVYRAPRDRRLFEGTLIYEQQENEPALNARRALHRIESENPRMRDSVWAHRVDTLGKMREVAALFAGAEIDVVYDPGSRALIVSHPPEPPSGLTLDALLDYANRLNPKLSLWLDVKNLTEANGAHLLNELNRLDAVHAIRSRALVETDHIGPAARALRDAGYRTSYYLPPTLVTQYADGELAFTCYGADEVRRAVVTRGFGAISYDWRGQRWVERCLGDFMRKQGLRRYTWDLEPVLSDARAHRLLEGERLRRYAAMEAVLLPYRTVFDDVR